MWSHIFTITLNLQHKNSHKDFLKDQKEHTYIHTYSQDKERQTDIEKIGQDLLENPQSSHRFKVQQKNTASHGIWASCFGPSSDLRAINLVATNKRKIHF